MLVNVVDVPPLCNFILPAIVRTGPLAVAISMPAPRRRWPSALTVRSASCRRALRCWRSCSTTPAGGPRTLPTYQDRKEFFESIVGGDPDPIELLREGNVQGAWRTIEAGAARSAARLSQWHWISPDPPWASAPSATHLDESGRAPDGRTLVRGPSAERWPASVPRVRRTLPEPLAAGDAPASRDVLGVLCGHPRDPSGEADFGADPAVPIASAARLLGVDRSVDVACLATLPRH